LLLEEVLELFSEHPIVAYQHERNIKDWGESKPELYTGPERIDDEIVDSKTLLLAVFMCMKREHPAALCELASATMKALTELLMRKEAFEDKPDSR
jgi:hypothetical protein